VLEVQIRGGLVGMASWIFDGGWHKLKHLCGSKECAFPGRKILFDTHY
jgi:hypothetical protein